MKSKILTEAMSVIMVLLLGLASPVFADRSTATALDDAAITTKVKYELASDVKLSTLKGVQVDTYNGEVTLTGRVYNSEEKMAASDVTRKVGGVTRVNNMLSVAPEQ